MKNKEKKIKYFSSQEGLDRVSNSSNFSWNQQTNSSSKSMIRKHVLSGVLAFFVCFAIFAAVVFPLSSTSTDNQVIALTEGNYWINDGIRGDSFAGGTGKQDDPYLIATAEQLAYLSYLVYSGTTDSQYSQYISGNYYFTGAYFKQTANIYLSAHVWQPIGIRYNRAAETQQHYFSGNYDGGGYTISGVKTPAGYDSAYSDQGLFGYVYGQSSNRATITNVGVINSNIQGYQYVGGIAGYADNTTITNCYNTGDVTGSGDYVGGIAGYANTIITNCYNTGSVTGTSNYVGGLIGNGSTKNCYNTGRVTLNSTGTGTYYVGGIAGDGSATNCFNLGEVIGTGSGTINIGGITGDGTRTNCYFGGDCTLEGYSSSLIADAKNQQWIEKKLYWDFAFHWEIDAGQNNGYPILRASDDQNWWLAADNYDTIFAGSGTEEDPYLISTAAELAGLSYLVYSGKTDSRYSQYISGDYYFTGAYFKQTADIDLSAHYWQPIGIYYDREGNFVDNYFSGKYDGGGYTISGVKTPAGYDSAYAYDSAYSFQGLFGRVDGLSSTNKAEIKNVGVINSNIQGYHYVGGIVGYVNFNTTITNCYNTGTVTGSGYGHYVGGIAGYAYSSMTITNCYNTGTVTGPGEDVGGIAGYARYTTITNCYNTGNVSGSSNVGGIAGDGSTITNCYNTGNVSGSSNVGGIAGYAYYATIMNCYNTGSVTGSSYVGGIAGYGYNSTIANCYYGGNCGNIGGVNGADTAGASYSATLATDAKDANWYRSSMPWDLNNVWQLDAGQNDGYPTLRMTSSSIVYWTDDGVRGTSFAGGSGTEGDPYLIETAEQLAYLSYMVYSGEAPVTGTYYYYAGVYFVQTADIDLSGYYWQPIGIYYNRAAETQQHYFSGNYDGGGHTVSGITTPIGTGNAYRYQGLFGYVRGQSSTNRPEITNIGVVDSFIQGEGYVGGIVGYISSSYGSVTNSYSSATIISIGYTSGNVQYSYAGGIVGGASSYTSVANNCYNTGSVFGAGNYVGGITGEGSVTNSYNLGTVRGAEYVGGITAYGSTVRNNFNLGSVSGSGNYLGGIAGRGSTVANNYYGGACENIGGVNGADIAGSAEFSETLADDARTQNWLTSTMGWDMYFVWKLDPEQNDGYPVFITDPAEANWWLASEDNYDLEWEGDGSRTNPYQISSAKELAGLSYRLYSGTGQHTGNYYYPNKYFVLTTNIDLSAHAWEPIGNATAYFSGVFDGAGYEISGVMGSSSYTYFALFSHVVGYGNRAEIKNLTVTDSVINAGTGAAGILVLGENISISNCTSDVTLNASGGGGALGYGMASGIALSVYNGVIENCENMSTLNGPGDVAFGAGIASFASNVQITGCTNRASFNGMYNGGITVGPVSMSSAFGDSDLTLNPSNSGYSLPATITDCANYGNLSGMGVAGIVMCAGEVLRCVNYGNIEGSSIAAGIVATNVNMVTSSFFSTTNIQYCVNYGTLMGYELGGIAAQLLLQNGTFANCTNYGEIVGQNSSGVGGVASLIEAATNTTLSNLANYGVISGSVQRIGGLIARIRGGSNITITLEDCVNANAISITGQGNSAGGLVGETTNSGWTLSFENCVNTGNITAANSTIGGIIGSVTVPVTMTSVFSLGDLTQTDVRGTVGGLIGGSTASEITIENCVFEGDITVTDSTTDTYAGGFIGSATGCSNLSITGSYVNTDITVASADAYASGMIGSITMSDTSSPAAIDKCAVVANISTSAEGEMTNSREFYFSPNLVDSATILNSYALFNNALTISDTTTGMDGYFAYLDNFQNGLPIPIGLYYITAHGTTTGIADQLQKFVG